MLLKGIRKERKLLDYVLRFKFSGLDDNLNYLEVKYNTMVSSNLVKKDERQLKTLRVFDSMRQVIRQEHDSWKKYKDTILPSASFQHPKSSTEEPADSKHGALSFFSSLLERRSSRPAKPSEAVISNNMLSMDLKKLKGIYLYGSPGCGKTFMMEMFYDSLNITEKKKVHFNEFMQGIHENLHALKERDIKEDPLRHIALENALHTRLLCLDEFQVTDIGDALMIKRLFEGFITFNMVIVATSNRPPDDLYYGGLQRHLFLPFIPFIKEKCQVINMDSKIDYRYSDTDEDHPDHTFLNPVDEYSEKQLNEYFQKFSGLTKGIKRDLEVVAGRVLEIKETGEGVAMFSFEDLCDRPMGSSDYMAIARAFRVIIIKDIPAITSENRNVARRFIILIDELYNCKTKLYCSARRDLGNLFEKPKNKNQAAAYDEEFAMERCRSRIVEMQTKRYMEMETYYELKQKGKLTHEEPIPDISSEIA